MRFPCLLQMPIKSAILKVVIVSRELVIQGKEQKK